MAMEAIVPGNTTWPFPTIEQQLKRSLPAQSIHIITVQQNQTFLSSAYTTSWHLEPQN